MRLLPERYDSCVVPWCLYLRTIVCTDVVPSGVWKLLPRMKQTCGGLQLFYEVLSDFFGFSHDVKQRGTEFEGRP